MYSEAFRVRAFFLGMPCVSSRASGDACLRLVGVVVVLSGDVEVILSEDVAAMLVEAKVSTSSADAVLMFSVDVAMMFWVEMVLLLSEDASLMLSDDMAMMSFDEDVPVMLNAPACIYWRCCLMERVYLVAGQEIVLEVAFVIVRVGPDTRGHRKVKDGQRHHEK